jgi:hypothetical protein
MSSRVLRRLRERNDTGDDGLAEVKEDIDDEDYESDDDNHGREAAFHLMLDDDSDTSSSDEEDEVIKNSDDLPGSKTDVKDDDISASLNNDDEDIDAILSEFKEQGIEALDGNGHDSKRSFDAKCAVVLHGNDSREYNLDNTMRNMLNGTTDVETLNDQRQGKRRSKHSQSIFARQRDSWGKRPSSYIGGGLGMDQLDNSKDKNEIPWPYNADRDNDSGEFITIPTEMQQWYTFQRSNTYSDRVREYQNYIANTGDINTMAMYIADNPFIVEPMFHFAIFFFSIGENEKGMQLLKRILWVMECASYGSFLHGHERDDEVHLMDFYRGENQTFFQALFRLAQTSCMVGCVVTSLAVGRFLLSLDPMRDPTGILMVLDYYALSTMREKDVLFLLKLVDSDVVKICHDGGQDSRKSCGLREMPNWAYNYALAMYRKSQFDDEQNHIEDDSKDDISFAEQADKALDFALARYPLIPRSILEKNGVNLKDRSFQTDWPHIMESLDQINRNSSMGVEKISSIFVERNCKLWSGNDVVKWLYQGCQRMFESKVENKIRGDADEYNLGSLEALEKYSAFDPMDFLDSFRRIPADANPLDPGLMDAALNYTPNRRRFLRINRQHGARGENDQGLDLEMLARQQRTMLGAGRNQMQIIDPDLPLMELFWRSMMPWARVEGVPPST